MAESQAVVQTKQQQLDLMIMLIFKQHEAIWQVAALSAN
jgi:hypothetical protein